MKTKILVAEIPFGESVESVLDSILRDTIVDAPRGFSSRTTRTTFTPNRQSRVKHCTFGNAFDEDFSVSREVRFDEPLPAWGVAGQPKEDKNKIFGAGFEVDEPRAEDYRLRWQFEDDHAAFDRFVEAGLDCEARGLTKKSNAPIHKVNAIRKRIQDGPVFNVDLIGETHWFND